MSEFRMPSLGADMESGTLVEWLKKPGDAVHRGDVVAVVETQKGAIEVEIFVDGVMGEQLVALGTKVPVGTPLAVIGEAVEAAPTPPPAVPAPAPVVPAKAPAMVPEPVKPLPVEVPPPERGVRASPAARQAAIDRSVDLTTVRGTGPEGAITLRDVEEAAQQQKVTPRRGLDLGKMREAIAAAMAHSKKEIPHYYLATEIAFEAAQNWLEKTNAGRAPQERLLPAALMLKSVALAAKKYPAFNGFHGADGFRPSQAIHVGMAIAIRGGGLVSPALHDCDQRGLDDLMGALKDLVARARVGRLRSSEIADATITVSSLGERGVEQLFGVIYPPQVALVGFGRITPKPVAVGDAVHVRPMMTATLAADHRVSDGHSGALFLNEIARVLQEPERL